VAYGERSLGIGKKEIYLWVTPCDLAKGAARPPLLISNDSDYADLDKMYALLASVAGKSDELLLHQAKEVSPSLAKWLEDANGRRDAAIQAAKVRRDAAIQAAKEKVEQERVIAVRQRDEVRNRLTQEVEAGAVGKAFQFPLPGNFSIKFMYCPAGKFIMGCPNPKELYPEGAHQVQVTISKGFWLASTELTQAQWLAVMGRTQSEMTQSEWSAIMSRPNATIYRENRSEFKGNSLPVNALDFYGAEEFIASLNDLELAPRGWKFALPTEAQWEYACRAGTTTALNNGKNLTSLEGPCSNLDEVAWYSQNSDGKPHSVGTKKPNAWGLYDMLGNVSEWCLDGHERALKGGTDPVAAPQKGSSSERVVRGGSFTARGECRSDYRGGNNKGYNHSYMGFRPILVPSE
jgi:formylglycine-generating enzyme required for sulfatase activity